MNKKLLATAIGAALVAGPMLAAQADVKIYGQAQVELGSVEPDLVDATAIAVGGLTQAEIDAAEDGAMVVEDNARGRFGVYATEDLGGGLTGLAKFEWRVDTADGERSGSSSLTARESWVGLKGGFGTFQAGNLRSAYKYTGGVKYDPFTATILEARSRGGMTGNDLALVGSTGSFGTNNFLSNSVGWMSPNWQGLKVWLTYSPDEEGDTRGSDGDYSASVLYGTKQWEVFAAAITNDQENQTGTLPGLAATVEPEYDSVKVGGMISLGNAGKISAQYEMSEGTVWDENLDFVYDNLGANFVETDSEITTMFVGYQLPFAGKWTAALNYGQQEWDIDALAGCLTCGGTIDVDYYTVGAIYKFSKQTRFFAGISSTEIDGVGEEDVISAGLRKDF